MSNQDNGSAEPIDDGFTPEERQQFDSMRESTAGSMTADSGAGADGAGDGAPGGDGAAAGAPAAGQPGAAPAAGAAGQAAAPGAAAAGEGEGDDDDAADGDGQPGAAGQQKTPRRVSWSRFQRETKELRDQIAASNKTIAEKDAMLARLDERVRIINEALTQTPPAGEQQPGAQPGGQKAAPLPKAEDDPEPNVQDDLFGWLAWKHRDDLRFRQSVGEERQQRQAQQQTVQETNKIHDAYIMDANAFAGQEPQFVPAYQYLVANRTLELAEYYFGKDLTAEGASLTPQEAQQIAATVAEEERGLVRAAIKEGKRPAERIFRLAKARGFRPTAPAAGAAAAQPGAGAPNGQAAANGAGKPAAAAGGAAPGALDGAAAPANGGGSVVRQQVEAIRDGQAASLSLSNGGASPAPPALDAKRLAEMPDEEFAAIVDQLTPTEYRRIFGG